MPPQQVPQGRPAGAAINGDLPPLLDIGNGLLATSVPHSHVVGTLPAPGGQLGVLTIRTTTATLTITLTREQAAVMADDLAFLRDSLSGAGLQTAVAPKRLIVPGRLSAATTGRVSRCRW